MFDWNNLFWACGHCNNTKGDRFQKLLNCLDPKHDVENWIKYEIRPYPGEKVVIEGLKDDEAVDQTVRLLLAVYNGTTQLKEIEAVNLRKKLLEEIKEFQGFLFDYDDDTVEAKERDYCLRQIKRRLKKSSAFTAFKRWIIKGNSLLKKEFSQYFD